MKNPVKETKLELTEIICKKLDYLNTLSIENDSIRFMATALEIIMAQSKLIALLSENA